MKKLFLLARNFPYGISEPYLEREIKYYEKFDEVHIFSMSVLNSDKKRPIEFANNIKIHPIFFKNKLFYIFNLIFCLFEKELYKELKSLIIMKKLNFKTLYNLLVFISREKSELKEIKKAIDSQELCKKEDIIYLYSYRFDYTAGIVAKLELDVNKVIKVSRAHGIDLYEFRHPNNYIPFRSYILDKLDRIYLVSNQGYQYLKNNYPEFKSKMEVSYLGTRELNFPKNTEVDNTFRILSCSNIQKVKRIDLIFDVLNATNVSIEWTHIGSGEEMDYILQKVNSNINSKLKVNFLGHKNNSEVLKIYQSKKFDLFINLSSSEGLPVSMMEVMSVGIPVLSTNVGGVSEIVNSKNGFLVDSNQSFLEISEVLKRIINIPTTDYQKIRDNAYLSWKAKFNEKNNYNIFITKLLNLSGDDDGKE